ncbi:hypothetical protein BCV72DRAFT_227052 [Rhizopus microsporus var. microsporus]|uniref:TPR-like protein n=1 Tax=Rhizopus microsporus var. microsporus TaxID=86635 RepID=A0A1X0R5A3_RHIZD|nr:hypothetical protein BCV72DRAFT_227052 [Rhizopus microsporus var. microsporus]
MDQEQSSFPEMEKMIHRLSVIDKITIPIHQTPGESDMSISSYAQRQPKELPPNRMGPREQEEADEYIRKAIECLFNNQFMEAKSIFQHKIDSDPLYANGLGLMTFIKAIMTRDKNDTNLALSVLKAAEKVATCQINAKGVKKGYSISNYFSSLIVPNQTGLPSSPQTCSKREVTDIESLFMANGTLRAYVIKAEACLLRGALQILQENALELTNCSSSLHQAYNNYTIVWQEYKKMGQAYTKHMDRDTVAALYFGLGSLHLLVSCFPPYLSKPFWIHDFTCNQQLGFALLKICIESKCIKSPFASLILLCYYLILCSQTSQIYTQELVEPALECLTEAQKKHPKSCIFFYTAGKLSRIAKNLQLSTQSFRGALSSCTEEWAHSSLKQTTTYEIAMNHILQLDWKSAAKYFKELQNAGPSVFYQYMIGACQVMRGERTKGILSLAQIPDMKIKNRPSSLEAYALQKVEAFQKKGYQDINYYLPGLELLLICTAFEQMDDTTLEKCLGLVQSTLESIYEREKLEYNIRAKQIAPSVDLPDYYDQRILLLLIKASIFNALKKYDQSIAHINWIVDNLEHLKTEAWVIPFVYWGKRMMRVWKVADYSSR